jgi:hypothetical protein
MKQMFSVAAITVALIWTGCKSKEEEKKEGIFPALSYIKSQVAHIDTSLYQITKLTSKDSTGWDTSFIKREEFRSYAKDFLDLPDITDKKLADSFNESKFFDATLNQAVFTYSPKDKEYEIRRQEVTVEPAGSDTRDKVKNIYFEKVTNSKDSTVNKKMLWMVDQSFQITTIIQKAGQPETSSTTKVIWE